MLVCYIILGKQGLPNIHLRGIRNNRDRIGVVFWLVQQKGIDEFLCSILQVFDFPVAGNRIPVHRARNIQHQCNINFLNTVNRGGQCRGGKILRAFAT